MSTPTQFKLRVSPELKAKIDAACDANGNSISAEINDRLEESFALPQRIESLQSDIAILKKAVESAHRAMENQNTLITLLTVRPSPETETPEYVKMHRDRMLAQGVWDNVRSDMEAIVRSLKATLDLVD